MKTSAFLIRVVICFLFSLIPLTEVENQIYSARMKLRGQTNPASNLIILNLEASDFELLKHQFAVLPKADSRSTIKADRLEGLRDVFFWDPSVFREVLKKILNQNPSAILVTWHIPNEVVESLSNPDVELLAKNPKVIWSTQFDSDGKFMKPARPLLGRANHGFNNLLLDSDGTIRRSVLTRGGRPSLTRVVHQSLHPSTEKPRKLDHPYLINYMGPAGTIRWCRLVDIIKIDANIAPRGGAPRSRAPLCGDLKNKIVLLARDSEQAAQETTYRTPFGEMTRSEVIANDIHTIVNHSPIYRATMMEQALIILAMIFGGAFYIIYYPVLISALAITGTGVTVIIVLFQIIFQLFDIYIPSANIGISLLITYLVFTGYRLAFQDNLQWRSLKQAQYLRELDQMKTNFLSLVSHDLKTPLAKIQAVVERLRRESQLHPEQLDSLENSTNELRRYITSILSLSKIESQRVILNMKSNDINRIIQQVIKRLSPLAQNKGIKIEEYLEPLFSIECDEDLIRQVLTNLVDNAIKYSPENSKVIVRSREIEGFVQVDVEDFGPGIPKDQLPLMFRKFSRFLHPIKEQVKGTGLGLYLSKYFIELHGGTIRLKSEEGKGTIFIFTLPLQGNESETLLG
jgi:two-component system, OmpR family, phosphate regulon sensor histidine kinase PhoR